MNSVLRSWRRWECSRIIVRALSVSFWCLGLLNCLSFCFILIWSSNAVISIIIGVIIMFHFILLYQQQNREHITTYHRTVARIDCGSHSYLIFGHTNQKANFENLLLKISYSIINYSPVEKNTKASHQLHITA